MNAGPGVGQCKDGAGRAGLKCLNSSLPQGLKSCPIPTPPSMQGEKNSSGVK